MTTDDRRQRAKQYWQIRRASSNPQEETAEFRFRSPFCSNSFARSDLLHTNCGGRGVENQMNDFISRTRPAAAAGGDDDCGPSGMFTRPISCDWKVHASIRRRAHGGGERLTVWFASRRDETRLQGGY